MKNMLSTTGALAVCVSLALLGSGALAQNGTSPESGTSAQPTKPAGKKAAQWWGADVTAGWSMMSWKERNEHRKRMRAMKTYDECKTYLDEHHTKMMERATERGKTPLAEPRRDACAGLKS